MSPRAAEVDVVDIARMEPGERARDEADLQRVSPEALDRRGRSAQSLELIPRAFRPCVVIPTYDNPETIGAVTLRAAAALRAAGHPGVVIVVDDGGGRAAQRALERLQRERDVVLVRRAKNGGKGAAVKDGLRHAHALGFTHAVQVDADGQHAIEDIPRLLEAAQAERGALVLGRPVFDASAPGHRRALRNIAIFWTSAATLLDPGRIADPMCGFRVYPVEVALRVIDRCGDRMDFDPEVAVRLVWEGCPVLHVETRVRYLSEAEGGVSHFRAVHDNVLVSLLYARLVMLRYLGMWRQL